MSNQSNENESKNEQDSATENESAKSKTPAKANGGGFPGWIRGLPAAWASYRQDLVHKPSTRFMTILWSICVIFLGISILSAANPLLLLFPGETFALPFQDLRPNVEFRGVERTSGNIVGYRRPMQTGPDMVADVGKLAHLVSEPVGLREGASADEEYADLEPLPRLGFAVRRVWFRGTESGQLVVDFRRSTLLKETSLFHKNRFRASEVPAERTEKSRDDKKKEDRRRRNKRDKEAEQQALAGYLDLYFRSLTATIFASQEDVQSVLYLLDGKADTIDEMDFDLDVRYIRPSGAE